MCARGPGSIPGTDKLDSGFHPSMVGKMRSNSKAQTTTRGSLAVSAGALEIATVIKGAFEVF